ncbi:7TM diverse intracellular signaling domain-containing protein [Flavobacterium sp.]|uniref:sensor histidine kinase n=1 Tax=Flavobacterium sp. TaxID=239 RepID=UPI0037C03A52
MHEIIIESPIAVVLLGAVILAIIYHIVMYFYNRDELLIHYLLYLFFTGVFVLQRTRFIYYWTNPEIEKTIYDYLNEPFQIIYLASYFNFILQSIEVKKSKNTFLYHSWIAILTILIGYSIIFVIAKLFFKFENYGICFIAIRVFIFFLTFIMLWQCFRLRHITFQLFILIGSALYFVFGIISFISNLNLSNDMSIYPPEWLMIGSFIDIIFFSIAMSYRNKKQFESMSLALLKDANEIIAMQKIVLEKQTALENERNRIALDMHDDMGSGLTKINYLSQMAISKVDVDENLRKINQTSSELVTNMSEIIWAMKEDNNTLADLISFVKIEAVEYLESNNIAVIISIPDNSENVNINGNNRRSIYMVIKEALHNIVKHAQANQVYIHFTLRDEMIEIHIIDNGVGFHQNNITIVNNGLKNMEQRVKKMNGTLSILSQNGTTIQVSLPLKELL